MGDGADGRGATVAVGAAVGGAAGVASPQGVRTSGAVYLALTVQTLISAGTYLLGRRALDEIDPATLVLSRFFVSGAALCLMLALLPGPALPPRAAIRRALFLGLLAGPVNQGLLFTGLARSTPAHAALLYSLTPLGVYVRQVLTGAERSSPKKVLGAGLAILGVAVLLFGRGFQSATRAVVGDLLILCAVTGWVIYTTESKKFSAEHGAFRATAWSLVASSILGAPAAPFLLHFHQLVVASSVGWISVLYLGLMTSVVSYMLWIYALKRTEASRVAIFNNLQPVVTAIAAWVFLDNPINWEIVVGGLLVLVGVRITQRG